MSKQVRYVNILMLIFLSAINNFIMTTAVLNTVISMSITLLLYHINVIVVIIINSDGSSQNPGIVQSRIGGRLTHWDRHLNNGRRSKISGITPVHLGAVTEHLFPFTAVERTAHR